MWIGVIKNELCSVSPNSESNEKIMFTTWFWPIRNTPISVFPKNFFSQQYSCEILRREEQKTCASMNKHEIFEQFEFPAQIWGFKLIPIKNLWILNFFHILSQMAAQGEDLNLEVLVIINKLLVCNQNLIGIWLS